MAGTGRKLTILSLKRKIELIEAVESGKKQKVVAEEFSIAPNSVSTIMKNKDRYKEQFYSGQVDVNKQRARLAAYDDIESQLLKWFTEMRGNNVPISGPLLKTKATAIASALGKDWECNEGWLSRFKKRHNIVFKTLCGESSSVDENSVDQWRETILKKKLANYRPCDIYNADETGLFWRLLPNKTMDFKGQECHGGKAPKDRITVLTCSNLDGSHKLPLLVIGKFKTPRCFKGLRALPVNYQSNSKAWMTADLFRQWAQDFDRDMYQQKRKVLLVLDNCTAHPRMEQLKAVELLFLPPNTTSKVQPCDMGIIANLKCHYRAALLKKIITFVDQGEKFEDFKLTLLDAVVILKKSWEKVEPATIYNCFKKAGFVTSAEGSETPENDDPVHSEPILSVLFTEYGITAAPTSNLAGLDDDAPTAPPPSQKVAGAEDQEEKFELPEQEDDDQGEEAAPVSEASATASLENLTKYFICKKA